MSIWETASITSSGARRNSTWSNQFCVGNRLRDIEEGGPLPLRSGQTEKEAFIDAGDGILSPPCFNWRPVKSFLQRAHLGDLTSHRPCPQLSKVCLIDDRSSPSFESDMLHHLQVEQQTELKDTVMLSICALLDEPDVTDPLVPEIAEQFLRDKATFDRIARNYTLKYAHSRPKLEVTAVELVSCLSGWQVIFLKDRLENGRRNITAIIQVLERPPLRTSTTQPTETGTMTLDCVQKSFYELSSEFVTLNEHFNDDRWMNTMSTEQFDKLQNFLDLCSEESQNLTGNFKWRQSFPALPVIQNDATRGTVHSYTYRFTGSNHVPAADDLMDLQVDAEAMPERIGALVKHAQWLNGDTLLVPHSVLRRQVKGIDNDGGFCNNDDGSDDDNDKRDNNDNGNDHAPDDTASDAYADDFDLFSETEK
ncbi:hypothetical protein MMC13_001722 [Lambiella insularis]|nr:hypothetical protein [Lambiella insularis]